MWLNVGTEGTWVMAVGVAGVLFTMFSWWTDVIREAHGGDHTPVVQLHLRYNMILFIASEVMFFVAWFKALFGAARGPAAGGAGGGGGPPGGGEGRDPGG